ncbi:hypothetical protein GGH99_004518 [Coemansia sp. RSA 1285]|nr:hypothetical protein GGH99_004518 [Coemansia sp. RSA 1285]
MQRALWTNYTSQLQQQLPSILLFSRPTPTTAAATMASEPADQQQESLLLPAALDEAGNACDGACASDSAHGRHHADATRWLVDSDNTLRRLLAPLVQSANHRRLARRSHLAALWNAVACWFPQQCVLRTITAAAAAAATQKHSQQQRLHPATEAEAEAEAAPLLLFQRMCVSAAFLLPPPLSDGTSSSTVASVLECLVAQLVAEAAEDEENSNNGNNGNGNGNGRGDGGGRGAAAHDALLFLAWRHRDKVLHKVAVCARRLDRAAGMAVSKLAEAWGDGGKDQRTVIMLSGYHREDEATVAANAAAGNPSADSDSAPALTPIPLALAFLVGQSRVFRAMLTGPFREAEAVVRTSEASSMGQTAPCSLHCSHATLTDLVAIVRRCAMSSGGSHNGRSPDLSQLAAQLEVLYSAGRLASALHLAVVYDLRHLAVLLLWFFVDRLGRGIVPDPARRSDDLACLWLFSLLYRDNGAVSDALDSIGEAAAAVDALGAAVLLCLDQVDTLDVVGSNADLFVSTLRFVLLDSE